MKGTVNKNIKVGNLGQDPETRYAAGGTCITIISIATSYQRKIDGEMVDQTEWHNVKFIGKLAEIAGAILYRGAKVYIEGRDQTDRWKHKEYQHITQTKHWIIASSFEMLSPFKTDEDASTYAKYGHPSMAPGVMDKALNGAPPPPADEDFEDDIPF